MNGIHAINAAGGGYRIGAYREVALPPQLAGLAEVGWIYGYAVPCGPAGRAETAPRHRVIPETGVSLCLASRRDADGRAVSPLLVLMGPIRAARVYAPVPGEHLEGVRVRPEWCRDLLGIDPAEHEDALDEVPAPLVRRLGRLADRLVRTRSPDGAVARLAYALGALAEAREPSSGARLAHRALEAVRARPQEPIDAGERARALGVSERHLRRVVREAAGTGLRAFHRVRRLQHAVSLADAAGMVRWSRLAVAAGYYDQAHLIHEVRACTGTTPAALHRERKTQRLVEGS